MNTEHTQEPTDDTQETKNVSTLEAITTQAIDIRDRVLHLLTGKRWLERHAPVVSVRGTSLRIGDSVFYNENRWKVYGRNPQSGRIVLKPQDQGNTAGMQEVTDAVLYDNNRKLFPA